MRRWRRINTTLLDTDWRSLIIHRPITRVSAIVVRASIVVVSTTIIDPITVHALSLTHLASFAALVVHVFEVEGVDVAREVAKDGQ